MTTNITTFSESKHFEWRIQNFFELSTSANYYLQSDCFNFSDAEWFLRIYPNGEEKCKSYGWISLYLAKKESTVEIRITYRIGVKKRDGIEFEVQQEESTYAKRLEGKGRHSIIERSQLLTLMNEFAPNGILTVFCDLQIKYTPPFLLSHNEFASQTDFEGSPTLIQDFKNLYFSSHHADVTIRVKEKEFRAHKCILSSRSSVFGSMFMHEMEEKKSNIVEIPDCDADTFENFLLFLYSGKLDSMSSSNALNLYRSADKYDVKELKDECIRRIVEKLSDDIFCDALHLATMHNEKVFLKTTTEYFINNAKTIISTTKWLTFLADNPVICNELLCKLLCSSDNQEMDNI